MVRIPLASAARDASYTKVFGLLLLLAVLYGYLVFSGPALDQSGTQHGLLANTFVITMIGLQATIWMLAARGALAIRNYANTIKGSPDAAGIHDIAVALVWLVVYMVSLSLTGALVTYSVNSEYLQMFVALRNHGPLLVMAVSVFYLFRGSRKLIQLVSVEPISRRLAAIISLMFALVSAWFVVHFFATVSGWDDGVIPRFVVSPRLLLFTYVLPHIITWAAVVVSIINIARYSIFVDGSIYRRLFKNLYRGVSAVFVCIFLAQIIMASSVSVSTFNWMVGLIYLVIIVATYGFLLIYRGVRELSRIDS